MSSLVTRLTLGAVGLGFKTFLRSGYCGPVTVNGLENIEKALKDQRRKNGSGIITVSNHISTLDDPLAWGIVPWRWYFTPGMIRWSLGAADIIFTNPVFSAFFRKGQVLETFRGKGIYQPAVDTAIEKLNQGEWIHLFGEGKVHQPGRYPPLPTTAPTDQSSHGPDQNQLVHSQKPGMEPPLLLRFKWGVGRILLESKQPPMIIPMWLTGFQDLMPEGRSFPWKYLPRRNVPLSVTFGEPISHEALLKALASSSSSSVDGHDMQVATPSAQSDANGPTADVDPRELNLYDVEQETRSRSLADQNWLGTIFKAKAAKWEGEDESRTTARIRIELTALIQREVEKLGQKVLGSNDP